MTTMTEIAIAGIGPNTCLRVWGEARMRNDGVLPKGWGWPSESIESRLRREGHGAKEAGRRPALTAPEHAVDSLENEYTIAHWVQGMLSECSPKQRVAVFLRFVRGKCYEDIAKQMTEGEEVSPADVGAMLEAAKARIRRGLALMSSQNQAHPTGKMQ